MVVEESSFIGLLPHWQTRTRRSPRLDYFFIGSTAFPDPFQQIENQIIDWIRHDRLLANVCTLACVDTSSSFCRPGLARLFDSERRTPPGVVVFEARLDDVTRPFRIGHIGNATSRRQRPLELTI